MDELYRKMYICRTNVRKVRECSQCLHFKECINTGVVSSHDGRFIGHIVVDILPMIKKEMAKEYGARGLPILKCKRANSPDMDEGYIATLCVDVPFKTKRKLFRKPLRGNEDFEILFNYVCRIFEFTKRKERN